MKKREKFRERERDGEREIERERWREREGERVRIVRASSTLALLSSEKRSGLSLTSL